MNTQTVFKTICPKCAQEFAAPISQAGQSIICPHCQRKVDLPAEPPREAVIPHPALLNTPASPTIDPPGIVIALNILAALVAIGSVLGLFFGSGFTAFGGGCVSAMFLFAFAQLVDYSHESAKRLARLEMLIEIAVNRPK